MTEKNQTRKEFAVHMLNEQGKQKAGEIARAFENLLNNIEAICGTDGREISLVKTKLEEASFFAKKMMAQKPENQKSDDEARKDTEALLDMLCNVKQENLREGVTVEQAHKLGAELKNLLASVDAK